MKPNSNSKKSKKTNFGKVSAKIKKVGGLKKATYEQIEHIFKVATIKYMITLEDQLKEDKAHLLLKQNTIETLEEDLRHKNNQIRTFYINAYKNTKKVNKVFDDYKEANDSLALASWGILLRKVELILKNIMENSQKIKSGTLNKSTP